MANNDTTTRTYDDLPSEVSEFFFGLDVMDALEELEDKHDLSEDADVAISKIVDGLIRLENQPERLPSLLQNSLNIDESAARALAVDVAGHLMLPISALFENVDGLIEDWGGNPADFDDVPRVEFPKKTAEDFVQETVEAHHEEILSGIERLDDRLKHILVSYVTKTRDAAEAVETLGRSLENGGLDIPEKTARRLVQTLDDESQFIEIVRDMPTAPVGTEAPPAESTESTTTDQPAASEAVTEALKATDADTPSVPTETSEEPLFPDTPTSDEIFKTPDAQEEATVNENNEPLFPDMSASADEVFPVEEADASRTETPEKKSSANDDAEDFDQTAKDQKPDTPTRIAPPVIPSASTEKSADEKGETDTEDKDQNQEAAEQKEPQKEAKSQDETEEKKKTLQPKAMTKDASADADTRILQASGAVDVFNEADEKEIRAHEKKAKKIEQNVETVADLDSAVQKVLQDIGLDFENDEQKTRFIKAVESRMRGVRNAYETRAQLESPKNRGGVGLSGSELVAVMETIEDTYEAYHRTMAQQAKKNTKQRIKAKSQQHRESKDGEKKQKDEAAEKRFREIAGRAKQGEMGGAGAQAGREPTKDDVERAKAAAKATQPRYSEASITQNGRPKVQDVRFERRLAGPVEQLAQMRLIDFRRLASTPKAAIEKIKDDIDLLTDQGTEEQIAGIKAWRRSPVSQEYARLSMKALSEGKKITDVIAAEQEAGTETLTEEEAHAIMRLNADLRF